MLVKVELFVCVYIMASVCDAKEMGLLGTLFFIKMLRSVITDATLNTGK